MLFSSKSFGGFSLLSGGPYITSAVVVSQFEGKLNACVHRLMVLGKDRLAARLVPGRHTHQFYQAAQAKGEEVPVAIAIGVDPLLLMAASTRVPPEKEFSYAAALRGAPVELVRLENGALAPHAEIVLEGYITGERASEGPFVDITGTCDLVRQEPVIRLTRMMTREDPIYHGLLACGRRAQDAHGRALRAADLQSSFKGCKGQERHPDGWRMQLLPRRGADREGDGRGCETGHRGRLPGARLA